MSGRHGLNKLGYIRATMVVTKRSKNVNLSKSYKNYLSSDCFLQHENMKQESLVIVYQHDTVNALQTLVHTARHAVEIGTGRHKLGVF
jgi:NADPH-dependent 7-cyano-7-deazaguanine reductase QueF-like protein